MDNGTVMHNSERVFVNTNMFLRLNIYIGKTTWLVMS